MAMDVYLVQHGEALSAEQDSRRPLSEAGRAATRKMARCLADRGSELIDPPITDIWHSGKLRAQQTAEILAQALGPQTTPMGREGLNPNDDPRAVCEELTTGRDRREAVLLVGHLPHLARLAGLLLAGDTSKAPIRLVNAGVLKISAAEDRWAVQWYVTPACVG